MGKEEIRKTSEQMGTLGGCLIEGDSEQKARERKVRRRALTISIGLQSAALAALLVAPLLAKPEKLAFNIVTPTQIYQAAPNRPVHDVRPAGPQIHRVCFDCFNHVSSRPPEIDVDPLGPEMPDAPNIGAIPIPGAIPGASATGNQRMPPPPDDPSRNQTRRLVRGGDVQQAMLLRRVDPAYPALARQLRHAGVVHLKAIISKEGNVESLQILDGDPLLVQSARDAVMQWHYRPTFLNGQAVEVETVVTVVYTLNQ